MAKSILFLSPKCALDPRSGAALSVRNILVALAEVGWSAQSLTMTIFDGEPEAPVEALVGPKAAAAENQGKTLKIADRGVTHRLFYTQSPRARKRRPDEQHAFYHRAAELLAAERPGVVVMMGDDDQARGLVNLAGQYADSLVLHLGNPNYADPAFFRPFDRVFVTTQFFADYYYRKLAVAAEVIPTPILAHEFSPAERTLAGSQQPARRHGFVTMVNPAPEKGGALFWRMAQLAQRERSDLTFLAVEGRMAAATWRAGGLPLPDLPNVWWLPNQADLRRVYDRTAVLLYPSLWVEAAGRCPPEAQLGGIPVLAANHSGIPEQLNGGGFPLEVPERCRADHAVVPSEAEARPWLDSLYRLMDDDAAYSEAVERALAAATPFAPERTKARIQEAYGNLPVATGPRPEVALHRPPRPGEGASGAS